MTLGERIHDLRKQKGLSQEQLAERLNMSRQSVAKWEQNGCEPNIQCLIAMSEIFETSLDYLLAGKAPEDKPSEIIREKETVLVKEKDHLLDKTDIILLIILITSIVVFIGLFVFALFNPKDIKIGIYTSRSFIYWYFPFLNEHIVILNPEDIWFQFLAVFSTVGIIITLIKFLKRRKNK